MATPNEVSEFDIMRQRIRERELQRGKETAEQVKGQFASRGTLRSGAQIKAQERGRQEVAQQAREERRDVLMAEAQVRRAQREAEAQRAFQRGERLGQQEFAAGQAREQRGFLTGEREAQQLYAAEQAALQRDFTTSERQALQTFQEKQRLGRQDYTTKEREAAQKYAATQAQLQRDLQSQLAQGFIIGEDDEKIQTLQSRQLDATIAEQIAMREQNAEQFQLEFEETRKWQTINALNAMKNSGFSNEQIGTILNDLGIAAGIFRQLIGGPVTNQASDYVPASSPPPIPPVGTNRPGLFDLGIKE